MIVVMLLIWISRRSLFSGTFGHCSAAEQDLLKGLDGKVFSLNIPSSVKVTHG